MQRTTEQTGPTTTRGNDMACFCGCLQHRKNPNGFRVECMDCGHGPQNHDDEFRAAARANQEQSQKRDADFG